MNKTGEHPNISLFKSLDLQNLDSSAHLFAENFIWHFFNPKLPEVHGDYFGFEGLVEFFKVIGETTNGTFKVEPISLEAVGDELVVAHVKVRLHIKGLMVCVDVVVVWRIVNGKLSEAWDIPSLYTWSGQKKL